VLKASALAQEAQVKMLRYQLNPHFLFNTLNAISTLILDGQGKVANQAIGRLSEFLRHTLDQDPMKKVTLRHEIEALNLYLGIEQLRFGDRLRLEYEIDEAALAGLVPSLILQPLVENSLKYAIAPREEGGRLRIIAQLEDPSSSSSWPTTDRACDRREPRRGPRGRLPQHAERLAALYGDHQTLAVRFARPDCASRSRYPSRDPATMSIRTIIVDDEPLAGGASSCACAGRRTSRSSPVRQRPRGAGRDQ